VKKYVNKLNSGTLKDIDFFYNDLFIASSGGLYLVPYNIKSINKNSWLNLRSKLYGSFSKEENGINYGLSIEKRCKAVKVEKRTKTIAAAFIDGLVEIDSSGMHPVMYNQLPVYSNSLEYANDKLFLATPG